MPSLETVTASNAQYHPATPPVALVLGGTAGIGHGIAKLLAQLTGGALHLIILGRNRAAAEELIATLPQHPASTYEFARVDATSMADVRRAAAALAARLTKINFLILTCGFIQLPLHWWPTPEGSSPMLAVTFLGRVRFVLDLMPRVDAAARAGERAAVLQVAGAGYGGKFNLDDLELRKWFAVLNLRPALSSYHDATLLELSRRYPAVHFVHNFPGPVMTNLFGKWAGALWRWSARGLTEEECAQYSLYPLLSTEERFQRGVTRMDEYADPARPNPAMTEEAIRKVWDYVVEKTKAPE